MALSDIQAADVAVLTSAADFGTAISYTPVGGVAQALNALLGVEQREEMDGMDGQMIRRIRTISLPLASLDTPPAEGDTCIIDGETWTFHQSMLQGDSLCQAQFVRHEPVRRTGEQHRIRRG